HFASKSAITLKDQFKSAGYCNSKNLMVQVCSAILKILSKPALEVALFRATRIQETDTEIRGET
ncbi:unnamed protein product, partial [Caenorhabditis brenneri]